MLKYPFLIGLLTVSTLASADDTFEQELRQGCAKVKTSANAGKKFYDQKQYQKALEQFQYQATWSSFCLMNQPESSVSLTERDVEIANNNVGLSYSKLGKPLWARAWFLRDAESKSSQFNLKQLPPPKQSATLAGKYVQYAGFGQWNQIELKPLKNVYKIEFNGLYMGLRSLIYGPNMGEFETTMPLKRTQVQYQVDDCKINLKFAFDPKMGHTIRVSETNTMSCGFGHNVSADGIFLKID